MMGAPTEGTHSGCILRFANLVVRCGTPRNKISSKRLPKYLSFCARSERWIYVKCIIVSMAASWKPSWMKQASAITIERRHYTVQNHWLTTTSPEPHTVKIFSGFSQEHGVNRNPLPNESNAVCDDRDAQETRNVVNEKLLIHARRKRNSHLTIKIIIKTVNGHHLRLTPPNNCRHSIFESTIRKYKWNIQC